MEQDDIITIDFKAFFKVLWKEKWLILIITTLFTAAGAYYAYNAREEFVSEGKILPEMSSGSGSSLGGLASLVGMGGFELGLKNNTEAIRPDLYPNVIATVPFFLELFDLQVNTRSGDSLSFEKFYQNYIEEGKEIKKNKIESYKTKPQGVIVLNPLTEDRIKDLKTRISANLDKKSGVIGISAKMPDPVVASQVSKYAMDYLTEYVTNYRTEKAKKEVDFLAEKVGAAKSGFYSTQSKKARYADQFSAPTIRLQSADVQRERLETEYRMSSTVYTELQKKYEEAKIKLQQETPVFQILEPPLAPNYISEPSKIIIILGAACFGFLIAVLVVIVIGQKRQQNIFIKT